MRLEVGTGGIQSNSDNNCQSPDLVYSARRLRQSGDL